MSGGNFWPQARTAKMLRLRSRAWTWPRIAAHLGLTLAQVTSKARDLRRGRATRGQRTVFYRTTNNLQDIPTMLHPDTPPCDPGRPFVDNLDKCERRWAALLGGERTLAFA